MEFYRNIPYSGKFSLVQIFVKIPFPLQKKFLLVQIFVKIPFPLQKKFSQFPHPLFVAGLTEDERCPVGEGRT